MRAKVKNISKKNSGSGFFFVLAVSKRLIWDKLLGEKLGFIGGFQIKIYTGMGGAMFA